MTSNLLINHNSNRKIIPSNLRCQAEPTALLTGRIAVGTIVWSEVERKPDLKTAFLSKSSRRRKADSAEFQIRTTKLDYSAMKKTFRSRLRNFSEEVFRNYLIMRMRWEISSLERQRTAEIRDLGNRVYRLLKRKKLQVPELDSFVTAIAHIDSKIEVKEENLREVIMRVDLPGQITGGKADVVEAQSEDAAGADKQAETVVQAPVEAVKPGADSPKSIPDVGKNTEKIAKSELKRKQQKPKSGQDVSKELKKIIDKAGKSDK